MAGFENIVTVGLGKTEFNKTVDQIRNVYSKLKNTEVMVNRAIKAAVKKTSAKLKTQLSYRIRQKVEIKKRDIDKHIGVQNKLNLPIPQMHIILSKSSRLPVHYFNPRQRKFGVSYKINKGKDANHNILFGAFMVPSLGIKVYVRKFSNRTMPSWATNSRKRIYGKERVARGPFITPMGPSPWGVFLMAGLTPQVLGDGQDELRKQMIEQLRIAGLRVAGVININRKKRTK